MSTRRPRIRAVATLPARRKGQTKDQDNEVTTEKSAVETNTNNNQTKSETPKVSPKKCVIVDESSKGDDGDVPDTPKRRRLGKSSISAFVSTPTNKIQVKSPSPLLTVSGKCEKTKQTNDNKQTTFNKSSPQIQADISDVSKSPVTITVAPQRRRIVKPSINVNAASRKEKISETQTSESKQYEKINDKDISETGGQQPIKSPIRKNHVSSSSTLAVEQKNPSVNSLAAASQDDSKDVPQRRRTVKPTINVMVASRKSKPQDKSPVKVASNKESPSHSNDIKSVSLSGRKILDNVVSSVLSPRNNNQQFDSKSVAGASTSSVQNKSPSLSVNSLSESSVNNPPLHDDCSFDPIIPLPSKTNRPKLKPTPRFALRRNSFQGSASEADEPDVPPSPPPMNAVLSNTPAFSSSTSISTPCSVPRVRHTSTTVGPMQQHRSRTTYKYKVGANIPHQARTMKDLIFYNPPNNAIQPKDDDIKREMCQIPAPVVAPEPSEAVETEEPEAVPVPQVKLGPNGEIVIDEQSLVIETSEAVRSRQRLQQLSVVWDGGMGGGGGKYMRGRRCKEWSHRETLRFYRALHTMGTDFSLMLSLFPGRSRRDLKVKFKKEERQNGYLVDKVLMNPLQFDMDELERDTLLDMEAEEREKEKMKEETAKVKPVVKKKKSTSTSLAAKCLDEESLTAYNDKGTEKRKPLRVSEKKMRSDYIAAKNTVLPSPARSLVPNQLEQGSLVLLQEKDGLKAYLAGGESLRPIPLSQDALQMIASKLGHNQAP